MMDEREPDLGQQEDIENIEWVLDPTDQALNASHNRNGLPDPFCGEV
ncbi:hypothetical protein ACOM2C_02325 [Pseudarthrobacter sp. So.54]